MLEGFADLMECGVASTVSNPKFPQVEAVLNEELGEAIYGDQTAAEALEKPLPPRARRSSRAELLTAPSSRADPDPGPGSALSSRRQRHGHGDHAAACAAHRTAGRLPAPLRHTLWRMRREWTAYLFIAPGLIIFSIFTLAALVFGFWLTFHEWSIIQPETPFVGLDNYRQMIDDEDFRPVDHQHLLLHRRIHPADHVASGCCWRCCSTSRSGSAGCSARCTTCRSSRRSWCSAILWKWLYNSDFGLFNFYLLKTHLIDEPLLWLSDQNLAMPAVIIMSVWGGVGFSMVIYLAGLQAIPDELYEAAEIDGAGVVARFWHVTLPLLSPTTLFLLVIGIIGSFQVFTQIFIMTQGGPAGRTATMVYFMYKAAFKFYEMGYASTLAFALFLMLLVVTAFQLRFFREQL